MLNKAREFRQGWPVLLASVVGGGTSVAVLSAYSMGAFVNPLVETFHWTRAEVTATTIFTSIGYLVAGSSVGALADRFGARPVALISQIFLILGFAAMSRLTSQIWTLYALSFLLAVFAAGTLPITWTRAVTGWFVRSRGLALGVSLLGTGLVGAMLPTYVSWLVVNVGWRNAFLGVAALPLVIAMPLTLLFFREPDKAQADERQSLPSTSASTGVDTAAGVAAGVDSHFTFRQAISTACFWQMTLSFLIAATTVSAVLIHAIPLLMDRGVSSAKAAAVLGLFGLAVTAGRLVSGYLLDYLRGPTVAVVIFLLAGLACGLLSVSGNNLALSGVAIVFIGLAAGAEADIAAYFTAKYFGRPHYGAIYGLLYALYCIGAGVGPLAAGGIYDITGSYDKALIVGLGGFVVAAVLAGLIRAPRPMGQASS